MVEKLERDKKANAAMTFMAQRRSYIKHFNQCYGDISHRVAQEMREEEPPARTPGDEAFVPHPRLLEGGQSSEEQYHNDQYRNNKPRDDPASDDTLYFQDFKMDDLARPLAQLRDRLFDGQNRPARAWGGSTSPILRPKLIH